MLGMVEHVVDYSYSHPDYRRRFTAVSTARAMPARLAEGALSGRVLFGTLVFHLPSFFEDLRRNCFDVRKYGVESEGSGKKNKVMRLPVRPRLYLTKAVGTHLQTAQL